MFRGIYLPELEFQLWHSGTTHFFENLCSLFSFKFDQRFIGLKLIPSGQFWWTINIYLWVTFLSQNILQQVRLSRANNFNVKGRKFRERFLAAYSWQSITCVFTLLINVCTWRFLSCLFRRKICMACWTNITGSWCCWSWFPIFWLDYVQIVELQASVHTIREYLIGQKNKYYLTDGNKLRQGPGICLKLCYWHQMFHKKKKYP